jgi:NAD+ synthase
MTDILKISLAQLNQSVGDFAANAANMLAARARVPEADLIVFPELSLIGYPPEDLVLKPAFVDASMLALHALAEKSADAGPAMLVGCIWRDTHGKVFNAVALLDGGKIVATRCKHELPNYGVFDEKRVFASAPLQGAIDFRGVRIGVPICEDIWFPDVCECLAETGAEFLISPNGSPFEVGKDDRRLSLVAQRIAETNLPLAYLNRIGGQDELVFDGASFVMNRDGKIAVQMADWEERIVTTTWTRDADGWSCGRGEVESLDTDLEGIYHAMMMGLRDYVTRNKFPGIVLGMSGGIDSAISAAVAVDALGPDRVWCVMMPSKYTSADSLEDAAACSASLGAKLDTISIVPAVNACAEMLAPSFRDRQPDLTEENIQSRARGMTLMALSNKFGHMVLTTGNKSEMSVGYATLYGDMCGGYSVLKDVYKLTVFDLCRWRNITLPTTALGPTGVVIPERIITKPPTAELRDNQKDSDSLPPYEVLDPILMGLVEQEKSVDEVVALGFDRATVSRIERLLYIAEYKRRQSPPGVKVGTRNFGRDRRYPITHGFRTA